MKMIFDKVLYLPRINFKDIEAWAYQFMMRIKRYSINCLSYVYEWYNFIHIVNKKLKIND